MFKLGIEHNRSMSAKIHWRDPLCVKTSFWRSSAVFFGARGSFAGFGGFQTEFGRVFYYGNTAKLAENAGDNLYSGQLRSSATKS